MVIVLSLWKLNLQDDSHLAWPNFLFLVMYKPAWPVLHRVDFDFLMPIIDGEAY